VLVWGCALLGFDPLTDRWQRLPQPLGGMGTAVWTGRELIGWGGGCCGDASSDGSAYSPATASWRKLAPSPLAPEQRPLGIWTGRELLLFVSGINPASGKPWPARFARAAAYEPATESWRRLAPIPDRGLRFGGSAAWDGHEMLFVGAGRHARSALAYDPVANHWRRLAPLPVGRLDSEAAWTGRRLLVWGSLETGSSASPAALAYDPGTDRWSRLARSPLHGLAQAVVWTGHELLVWGGVVPTPAGTNAPVRYLDTGAAFTPVPERSAP
jgi:N-acetylneuraminic acid mutarotase